MQQAATWGISRSLYHQSTVLVHQRGGGFPAAEHRRQGVQVLQLPARSPEGDGQPLRRPGRGRPYTELRRHLLAAHQLKDIQRVEQLFSLLPLGAKKLSELLAEMLRFCPRGQ